MSCFPLALGGGRGPGLRARGQGRALRPIPLLSGRLEQGKARQREALRTERAGGEEKPHFRLDISLGSVKGGVRVKPERFELNPFPGQSLP